MFDIGFLELFVIGIIALLVLGPERLPRAARTVGLWVGKAKQGFNSIKQEIDRELNVQELQKQLDEHKAKVEQKLNIDPLKNELSDVQNTIKDASIDLDPIAETTAKSKEKHSNEHKVESNE